MNNILSIALCFLILSCSKKDSPADIETKDLPQTIQTQISEAERECPTCGIMIAKYQYNKSIVYGKVCVGYSASQGVSCNCMMIYYGQNGERISYEAGKYQDINDKKKLIKEDYRCSE